jgi:L-threonylcarbamoyladenylate synthase
MRMNTLRLQVARDAPETASLLVAAKILRGGGTVAFATETVYGLGANALDSSAVEKIFLAKQRPSWDPLIVHIADRAMLTLLVEDVPPAARLLIERFWPGPLTLLLPKLAAVPETVTAGRPRVGVRMPAHPVARALIRAAGLPIAAPSANLFGHTSPTTAAHVLADLDGAIDAVVDSGPTDCGLESSVLDACEPPCVLYRPGAITLAQIREVWPETIAYAEVPGSGAPASLPSPGVGMRHYAPRARLLLVESESAFASAIADAHSGVGVMLPDEFAAPEGVTSFRWGSWSNLDQLAQHLYAGLRALDDAGVTIIVCPVPGADGVGTAIRDRLEKAARQA